MSSLSTAPTGIAKRLAAGLAALVTIVGVVAGGPVVLLTWAPSPLPDHLPDVAEVLDTLTAPDSGALFLRVLTAVAWMAWFSFTLCVVVEAAAALRHRPSIRLPGLGGPQRLVAALIAAVLLASAPTMASGAPPASAAPTAAAWLDTSRLQAAPTAPAAATVAPSIYVVAQGDRLAEVAERLLGDSSRYRELTTLTAIDDVDLIRPGEPIWLPANARDRGPRTHAAGRVETAAGIYTVTRDDRLAEIAERFLGDPGAFRQLARVSGIADPDLIGPGQRILIPSGARDNGARPHANGGFSPARRVVPAPPPSTAPKSPAPPAPGPVTPAPSPPVASASAAPSTPRPDASASARSAAPPSTTAPSQSGAATTHESTLEQALPVGAPLAAAGLLAAVSLAILARRRRRQQNHRPVGRRVPMPSDPRAETELRAAAQPVASDRLDQALRVLGSGLAGRPAGTVPDIVGVWLDGETVHLLLTKPCAMPPTPWVSDGTRWTLPAEAVLPPVEGLLAALPALATVGSQPGTHLLLDLERLGTLTLVGDPARCADLLRYLAAELASNTWSDHVDVMLAGFDAEEVGVFAALSGGERIEVVPSAAEGIAGLRRRVAEVVGNVSHRGATDALDGRLNDTAADGWTPYVLLAADCGPDDLNSLDALDTELAAAGRCAAAVVIASDRNAGRWTLQIATDGRLDVPFLGIQADDGELTAASLPRIELSALAELLATADRGLDSSASTKPPTAPDSALHLTEGDGLFAPPRGEAPSNQATEQDRNASANAEAASDPVWDGRKPPVADASAMANEVSTQRSAVPRNPDDTLDGDLAAWLGADPTRPRIGILGPVSLEAPGTQPRQRQRFHAEVAVYLAGCGSRGATPDRLDDALWPNRVIEPAARRVAITRTRTWLGKAPGGEKWLPELDSERRYRLRDGYLLDWHLFRRLRARAEGKGPDGVADLRAALSLVRGAPLAGADVAFSSNARNPYPWLTTSDLAPMHLVSAIVDTAHHLVDFCLAAGDLREARWAADQAWVADVDRDSDIPWRDHLRIAAAAGNEAELEHLLGSLMSEREAEVPEDLDRVTYQLLCEVMPDRMGVAGR